MMNKLCTLFAYTKNHLQWKQNWVDMMSFENTVLDSPVCSCLKPAFVVWEWFHLLKVSIMIKDLLGPINFAYYLSAFKKQSLCLVVLWSDQLCFAVIVPIIKNSHVYGNDKMDSNAGCLKI